MRGGIGVIAAESTVVQWWLILAVLESDDGIINGDKDLIEELAELIRTALQDKTCGKTISAVEKVELYFDLAKGRDLALFTHLSFCFRRAGEKLIADSEDMDSLLIGPKATDECRTAAGPGCCLN